MEIFHIRQILAAIFDENKIISFTSIISYFILQKILEAISFCTVL